MPVAPSATFEARVRSFSRGFTPNIASITVRCSRTITWYVLKATARKRALSAGKERACPCAR
eukprot:3961363-Lingulodinium_polyedra.AAC.1